MKTLSRLFASAGILVFASAASWAQTEISEGKVVFDINYENADMPEEYAAMMPKEMTMYFKPGKSRTEMGGGMGMNQVFIYDYKARSMVMLMDMMGRKISIRQNESDIMKLKDKRKSDYKITKTGQVKTIAGHPCRHAVVKSKEGEFDLYYTTDVMIRGSEWANEFEGIDGFPLQYNMEEKGMKMNLTAKSIAAEKVEDARFAIPADYKEMSSEEMMKSFGQGK